MAVIAVQQFLLSITTVGKADEEKRCHVVDYLFLEILK